MERYFMSRFSTVSALALMISAAPAFADVTPQQVWDDLSAYMGQFGYEVSATQTQSGNDLNLDDIVLKMSMPEEDLDMTVTLDQLMLKDQGDGSVAVLMPEQQNAVISGQVDGADEFAATLAMAHQGLVVTVSGTPEEMLYSYNADNISASLSELQAEGETIPAEALSLSIMMKTVAGQATVKTSGDLREVDQSATYQEISFDVDAADPEGEGTLKAKGSYKDVVASGLTAMPKGIVPSSDYAALFAKGMLSKAQISHGGGALEFEMVDGETVGGSLASASGKMDMRLSQDGMLYDAGSKDLAVTVTGALPVPVSAAMQDAGFSMIVPTKVDAGPQDAKLALTLGGFSMDDLLWSLVDGGNVLPRDPATIALDLSAKVTPLLNLFDSKDMERLEKGNVAPGELNEVTLTNLLVEAAGAKVMGKGAFVFDNSDLETFDGLPRPQGQVELKAEGLNGLLDNLVSMGLLQASDVGGVRMMMAMFTQAGDTPDSLTSTFEVNDKGHVLANGQRLQ
jgi:hypothetical protein